MDQKDSHTPRLITAPAQCAVVGVLPSAELARAITPTLSAVADPFGNGGDLHIHFHSAGEIAGQRHFAF